MNTLSASRGLLDGWGIHLKFIALVIPPRCAIEQILHERVSNSECFFLVCNCVIFK